MTSVLDNIGNLLKDVTAGRTSETDLHDAYDQIAPNVPQSTLAAGLTDAFKADETPEFGEMLITMFNQSSAEQKAGILNQILSSLGPGAISQIVGSGALAGALSGAKVTPQEAAQMRPSTVQILAQNAANKDPSIVDTAANFYAQHPTLVKAIGAGALALLLSKIAQQPQKRR